MDRCVSDDLCKFVELSVRDIIWMRAASCKAVSCIGVAGEGREEQKKRETYLPIHLRTIPLPTKRDIMELPFP